MGFSRIVGFEAVVKVLKVLWDSLGSSELWGVLQDSLGFCGIFLGFFGILRSSFDVCNQFQWDFFQGSRDSDGFFRILTDARLPWDPF